MIFTYTHPKAKECIVTVLAEAGLPVVNAVQSGPEDYCKATYEWLEAHWAVNLTLLKWLADKVKAYKEKKQLHLPVRRNSDLRKGKALAKLLMERQDDIEHISVMMNSHVNKPPPISLMFNNMTYAQRQEILRRSNAARREEVPEAERVIKPRTNDFPLQSL